MTTKTCPTCKYRVAGTGFHAANGCGSAEGSRSSYNADGRCLGHTYTLRTWLFKRWFDRRPRA